MAYLTGSRSQFPEQLDTILELFNLPPSQKDNAARYQYLATKENLSSLEQTELNNLSVILQDYLPDVETWNLFGDILINMQKFFKEGVEPFVNDLKDNALNEIEDKKQDIIDYMDSTEAGLIRNDIGVMGDSTIEGRSLIEKTNKLKDDIDTLDNDKANKSDLNIHVNNALLHASYGTTSGTVNDYSAVVSPIPDSYKNGMRVTVKMHAANTGASTLRLLNTSGAFLDRVPLKKANGNNITNLKKDGVYTFVYSDGNFILQGEGGEYGTAQAKHVLSPYTIGTENGIITGTMPDNGLIQRTITTQGGQVNIPSGYIPPNSYVKAQFSNLYASNIKKGVTIGGVKGSYSPSIKLIEVRGIVYCDYSESYKTIATGVDSDHIIATGREPGNNTFFRIPKGASAESVYGIAGLYVDVYFRSYGTIEIVGQNRGPYESGYGHVEIYYPTIV